MPVTYKIETINPQKATEYLNTMIRNRPLSNATVGKYAGMMRKNQWILTHQGIAFDDKGHLFDGQHRLWAVVESNSEIEIMVTRGLPDRATRLKDIEDINAALPEVQE